MDRRLKGGNRERCRLEAARSSRALEVQSPESALPASGHTGSAPPIATIFRLYPVDAVLTRKNHLIAILAVFRKQKRESG